MSTMQAAMQLNAMVLGYEQAGLFDHLRKLGAGRAADRLISAGRITPDKIKRILRQERKEGKGRR